MNNRRKLVITLGASALSGSLAALAQAQGKIPRIGYMVLSQLAGSPKPPNNPPVTPAAVPRNRTLVIFNTHASAVTADGQSSEACADYFALNRGYGDLPGRYYKLGVNFGGRSKGMTQSDQVVNYGALVCGHSYAPGATIPANNPRYSGQLLTTAIKNIVNDHDLWAVFVESMVPNSHGQYGNNAPDGRYFSTLAKSTRMPYGRIGYPGCTYADIVRLVTDANWAETQDNTVKLHVVGGTDYTAGGDYSHMKRANASFAARVPKASLGVFDQDRQYTAGGYAGAGFVVSWAAFDGGGLTPKLDAFGMMFSRNPSTAADYVTLGNTSSWNPLRGAWVWNWCSGAALVGYKTLQRGGCAAILCESEPFSNGIPATDYVATALMAGKTIAEANSGSDEMAVPNASVYGVPDYAPYVIRGAPTRPAALRRSPARARLTPDRER